MRSRDRDLKKFRSFVRICRFVDNSNPKCFCCEQLLASRRETVLVLDSSSGVVDETYSLARGAGC